MPLEQKHLALFISSLQKGGSERVLANLADFFFSQGYRVTIVTQYLAEDEYQVHQGVERIFSEITQKETGNNRLVNFYRRYMKLRMVWKKLKPDLILSFIGKNNLMALLTSRMLHIPVVVSVRGEPAEEYHSRFLAAAARSLFRYADGVVMQTKESLDFFPKAVRKKAVVLHNSLNPSFITECCGGERDTRIVAVGRIDANKNHEMLLRAFAALAPDFPRHTLAVYGEGELRQPLIAKAAELGLESRAAFPGAVSDVAGTIKSAAVFVLTSFSEGMPNTLLEAMALGLPVISTDCPSGGPKEMIEDGVNGFLIGPGDVTELERCLRIILSDSELARTMGERALQVRETLHPDRINESWKAYFERLMQT